MGAADPGGTGRTAHTEPEARVRSCAAAICPWGDPTAGGTSWYLGASQPDFYVSRPSGLHPSPHCLPSRSPVRTLIHRSLGTAVNSPPSCQAPQGGSAARSPRPPPQPSKLCPLAARQAEDPGRCAPCL